MRVEFKKKTGKTRVEKERTLSSCVVNGCLHFTEASIQSSGLLATKYCRFFSSPLLDLSRTWRDSLVQLHMTIQNRRLDEYERTLATLSSSFCETYGCLEIGKFALSMLNLTETHRLVQPCFYHR